MTDEERLQAITEQLIIVRDNLFRGMSKSMQKLQAKSINEVLELPNFIESPQRTWVGLRDSQKLAIIRDCSHLSMTQLIELVEEEIRRNNNA